MWPDWVEFCHFGKNFEALGNFYGLYSIWQFFQPIWAKFVCFWVTFLGINGQKSSYLVTLLMMGHASEIMRIGRRKGGIERLKVERRDRLIKKQDNKVWSVDDWAAIELGCGCGGLSQRDLITCHFATFIVVNGQVLKNNRAIISPWSPVCLPAEGSCWF